MGTIARPTVAEHAPYYSRYIDLVPDGDILAILVKQVETTVKLLSPVDEQRATFRYAPGKWSIKEVVGHVIDTERVFAFRAFAFSRNDKNPLPGMEQEDYARGANYEHRPFGDILDEFRDVRRSTLRLFRSFSDEMLMRTGTASGYEFSVRCFPYFIAGHELHHANVLRDLYLR